MKTKLLSYRRWIKKNEFWLRFLVIGLGIVVKLIQLYLLFSEGLRL